MFLPNLDMEDLTKVKGVPACLLTFGRDVEQKEGKVISPNDEIVRSAIQS